MPKFLSKHNLIALCSAAIVIIIAWVIIGLFLKSKTVINVATLYAEDTAGLIDRTSLASTYSSCILVLGALSTNPDLQPQVSESLKHKATIYASHYKTELEKNPDVLNESAAYSDKLMIKLMQISASGEEEALANAGTACIKALR